MQIHHIWERGGQTNGRFLACRGINIGLEEKGGLSPPFPRPPSFILRLLIHHRSFLEVVSLSLSPPAATTTTWKRVFQRKKKR